MGFSVALGRNYLDEDTLRVELGDQRLTADPTSYERAIAAASRWIDRHTMRHFWLEAQPTARLVRATSRMVIRPGDFATTDDMTVEVDTAGDGVFVPLDGSAWQAEPFSPHNGWPYERVTPTGDVSWPVDARRPRVKVTARWGWADVPPEVGQACVILSIAYLIGKDVISNEDGYSIGSRGPTSPIELAQHLLEPFTPESTLQRVADRMMGRR